MAFICDRYLIDISTGTGNTLKLFYEAIKAPSELVLIQQHNALVVLNYFEFYLVQDSFSHR